MDKNLQHSIDHLLLEQGEFNPLEFLLAEGRITYADYEAWRNGEISRLEDALFGDPDQIRIQLDEAGAYARALSLQAERLSYTVWGSDAAGQTLYFSQNSAFNDLLHTCYRKAPDQPQMDLFIDAPGTSLANGIVLALIERNPSKAQQLLDRLYDTEPGHARLGGLAHLLDGEARLSTPINDVLSELDYLRNELAPLAEALLGHNSRTLIIPHWRRLSAALQAQNFDPDQPDLHRSYAMAQALDWVSVQTSIERENAWQQQPLLLQRYGQACTMLRQTAPSLLAWFELCWYFPDNTDAITTCSDLELQHAWLQFIDLEPELNQQDFPAWLLLQKPGLTKILPSPNDEANTPADYAIVYKLQQRILLSGVTLEATDISLRAELKHLNRALFAHFAIKLQGRH